MLYPLEFEPIYKRKVWGGRKLERLGRTLPGGNDEGIGESWEIADLSSTAPGGGGGGEARSRVANGPLRGATLHDLLEKYGPALHGTVPLTERGEFPLLVKFLDSRENLSVQVHPSPAYAAEHPEAHLKSEAWYVVEADPGAVIYKGLAEGVTAEQVREAVQRNTADAVEPLLRQVPAEPGDCHYLPSGTVHALGAGVLVAEVQTPSDTTFRLFDWGRTGRELHVEQAIASMLFQPIPFEQYQPRKPIEHAEGKRQTLVRCEHFQIERFDVQAGATWEIVMNHRPGIWMVLEGAGTIEGEAMEPVSLERGKTVLLPAEMPAATLRVHEPLVYLDVRFPQGELIA